MNHTSFRISAFVMLIVCQGCLQSKPAQTAPQIEPVSYQIPNIVPQAETKSSQIKAGIEISMTPVTYAPVSRDTMTYTPTEAPNTGFTVMPADNIPRLFITWKKGLVVSVKPDRLKFMVKINNQLPRVFHGAGMVVHFNVGGQLQAVQQAGYQSLTSAIVPPRTEQEIEIIGPPLTALQADKGIIGVFLYDVVTNENEAGVVTEKQNFEWYFDYTMETKAEDHPFTSGTGWIPVAEYQAWRTAENARSQVEAVQSMAR